MPHFSANLWLLYPDLPELDRFAAAARAGFHAVEVLFPYRLGLDAVKSRLDANRQSLVLLNCPPGDETQGEWGLLALPHRVDAFRRGFELALDAARRLDCPRINLMPGNRVPGLDPAAQLDCAAQNLHWALPLAAQAGVTLLVEPLNAVDRPDYFLLSTAQALSLIRLLESPPNFKLQYDVYHSAMQGEPLLKTLTAAFPYLGHVQIADAPGRHQPGTGQIDFPAFFSTLVHLGYTAFVGLEYLPLGATGESFGWMKEIK